MLNDIMWQRSQGQNDSAFHVDIFKIQKEILKKTESHQVYTETESKTKIKLC